MNGWTHKYICMSSIIATIFYPLFKQLYTFLCDENKSSWQHCPPLIHFILTSSTLWGVLGWEKVSGPGSPIQHSIVKKGFIPQCLRSYSKILTNTSCWHFKGCFYFHPVMNNSHVIFFVCLSHFSDDIVLGRDNLPFLAWSKLLFFP